PTPTSTAPRSRRPPATAAANEPQTRIGSRDGSLAETFACETAACAALPLISNSDTHARARRSTRGWFMRQRTIWLSSFSAGAATPFLLDPVAGRRRRHRVAAARSHPMHRAPGAAPRAGADMANGPWGLAGV